MGRLLMAIVSLTATGVCAGDAALSGVSVRGEAPAGASAALGGEVPGIEVRRALGVGDSAPLESAIRSGDWRALDQLFATGASVETLLSSGDTPLLAATRAQRPELVALCLDWCAHTGRTGADGLTALVLATVSGCRDLATQLVEAGADPNQPLAGPAPELVVEAFDAPWFRMQLRGDARLTPFMLAAVRGDEDLVRMMLDHGGRPYQRTARYATDALVLACRAGHIRVAQRMLGRDPDDQTGQKLVVVLGDQRATFFRGHDVLMTSKVSTGRKGYDTPTGDYLITSKHRDWTSTIYKAPMPYLLRLNASAIGLHQGAVPGYPASHGCIRLPAGKAAAFFRTARVGDRVLIRH